MAFYNYLSRYTKNNHDFQTHLSFNKGKYNVPEENFDEFYKLYYKALLDKEDLYLIEKVYNCNFKFFLDIDAPKQNTPTTQNKLTKNDLCSILNAYNTAINEVFEDSCSLCEYILSKRNGQYHVNYCNLILNKELADILNKKALEYINSKTLQECIDTSVYRTGLRMLGSKKGIKSEPGDLVYKIYDLDSDKTFDFGETTYETFSKTIVRVKETSVLAVLQSKYEGQIVKSENNKKMQVKGIKNKKVIEELGQLLVDIKSCNTCIENFDMNIERIYAKQNKMGLFCYYVSIKEKTCPFKNREHKRPTCPLYLEISIQGIYVKCYDQDCLRRTFPEEGLKLPDNDDLSTKYTQLHMSMTSKYWNVDIKITDEIKRNLEDSLKGSHFQIAKAAFNIFKDRFRVDDIRNTTWFEYDGVRWNKSYLMNILISEELPKYYNGIKISDTSYNDFQEFLVKDVDANVRNQMVDNIITKLENVNFKANVLQQLSYFFKNLDPDFYSTLDSSPYIIGFKNGVYDFKNNIFRESSPNDNITFSTGYDYIDYDESYDEVQEIYDFLSKIIPNVQVREYLLKVLGKGLVGLPDERFYIWTGLSGANGKSTLINFLESTLGDYAVSVDVSLITNKRTSSSNASPDVVRTRGRRFIYFQEPEYHDKIRTGILKQFTGGDTIIARELFKSPITFKLQATMIMCCNDLPSVTSIDGGTWRRIRVIEFKSRFCDNPVKKNEFKIDTSIKTKLKEWRPYFMSILIHWYNKYLYEGLNEPPEVTKATAKYKVDNDKFNEFFDQCIEECDTFETNKIIYNSFQNWWTSNYSTAKIPEIKELRRALKIKFGNEIEKSNNGMIQYGFNVKVKQLTNICLPDDDL